MLATPLIVKTRSPHFSHSYSRTLLLRAVSRNVPIRRGKAAQVGQRRRRSCVCCFCGLSCVTHPLPLRNMSCEMSAHSLTLCSNKRSGIDCRGHGRNGARFCQRGSFLNVPSSFPISSRECSTNAGSHSCSWFTSASVYPHVLDARMETQGPPS